MLVTASIRNPSAPCRPTSACRGVSCAQQCTAWCPARPQLSHCAPSGHSSVTCVTSLHLKHCTGYTRLWAGSPTRGPQDNRSFKERQPNKCPGRCVDSLRMWGTLPLVDASIRCGCGGLSRW
eukprot:1176873-Prorocentrum_minimum.AAC.1